MDMSYYAWGIWLGVGIPLLWLATLLLSGPLLRSIAARTRYVLRPPDPPRPEMTQKQRRNWDAVYSKWWLHDRLAYNESPRLSFQ